MASKEWLTVAEADAEALKLTGTSAERLSV